ncbi:eukaryotic translation initiation factor, partial [Plasmodium falciparum IGH-CR14]
VTKKIQEVVIKKKLNKEINNRLNLKNFNIDIHSSVTVEPTDVVNIEVPKNNPLDFLKDTEYDYLFAEQTNKTAKDLKNRFKILKDEETEDTQNKECTVRVTNLSEDVNREEAKRAIGKIETVTGFENLPS